MERKTILFTVDGDSISPKIEQKAGVQGSHNITEVRFEGDSVLSAAVTNPDENKVRMQFIDGAGGFFSSGFLTVVSDEVDGRLYVTCPIPNNVTNSGGLAYVYLVVTEIYYEDGKALEDQVYISPPGKLLYTHSGVGSPAEYAYKVGITNALVNAEIFVGRAEKASESAKGYQEEAGSYASIAVESAENAARDLRELRDGIASGNFKGEPGPQGQKGDKGDKGEKGDPGETPDLTGYISMWQSETYYKERDVCYWDGLPYGNGINRSVFLKCKTNHTSHEYGDPLLDLDKWYVEEITANKSIHDANGKVIHETYATKEEVGNIETALNNIITLQNQLIGGDA